MVAVVGSLAIDLRADTANVSKALTAVGVDVTALEKRTNVSLARMDGQFKAKFAGMTRTLGTFGKAGLAGLIAGLTAGGAAGLVNQLGQVARGVAEIGDKAKMAGLDVKSFQELAYVAKANRVEVDALTDGLKELSLRADEFILTGKGSAAEAFSRLGFSAEELKRKLQDPSALFTEIIGKLGKLDRAAQIRISDELFGGTGGEKFVQLIEQGEAGIRRTIDEAHRLGAVMDEAMIKKAAEVDRQFQIISTTVGTALKGAIVSAASGLLAFIELFRDFENQRDSTLDLELRDIGKQRLDIENEILRIKGEQSGLSSVARDLGFGPDAASVKAEIDALEAQDKALADQEQQILNLLEARRKLKDATGSSTAWTPPSIILPPATIGGSRKESFKPERDAFANMLGYTEAYRQEQELANQRLEEFGNLATDAGRALFSAFEDGKLEARELLAILFDLIAQMARMPGGIGGLLGTIGNLFSRGQTAFAGEILSGARVGLFHGGGSAGAPTMFRDIPRMHGGDGLKHNELMAVLENTENVITGQQTNRIAGALDSVSSMGGPREINVNVSGARGNSEIMEMVKAGVTQGIKQYDKTSAVRFPRDARNAKTRGAF